MAGMRVEDMLGRTVWELVPAVLGTEMESACRRAVASGTVQRLESYDALLGRWFEQRLYPTADGLAILSSDVTERRQAEQALGQREAEFRAMFELAGVGLVQVDAATGRFLRVNRRQCEITGYSPEELLGMTFAQLTHPEDRDHDLALFARLL